MSLMAEVEDKVDPYQDLPSNIGRVLNQVAGRVAGSFGGHSLADDLAQAGWLWIGEHPRRAARWWYDVRGETRFSFLQFRRDMATECARIAKRDRAFALGYNPTDEYPYATAIVRTYLPYVWHSDALAAFQDVAEVKSSTRVDPSRGGNAAVLAMDVRRAYRAAIAEGSELDVVLFALYAADISQQDLAAHLGVHPTTVAYRHKRAILAIVVELNGTDSDLAPGQTLHDGPRPRS